MEIAVFAGPYPAGQQLDDGAAVCGTPDGEAAWGWSLG